MSSDIDFNELRAQVLEELSKLYPKKVEGTIPTIEEIEAKLSRDLKDRN